MEDMDGGKDKATKSLTGHNQGDWTASSKQGVSEFKQKNNIASFVF